MFRGHWLPSIAVIGLAVAVSAAYAQPVSDDPGSQPSTSQTQTKPPDNETPRILGPIERGVDRITGALETLKPEPKSAREDERAERDLNAQEGMAYWAKWMFWSAGASVVLTGIGVLLIAGTLVYTKRAAIAAADAVRVTRDLGEAQIRAYLHCKSAKYSLGKEAISAILVIENTGQSPASDVSIRGTVTIQLVGGHPSDPRVYDSILSSESEATCQPIVSRGIISEQLVFFFEYDFIIDNEGYSSLRSGNFKDGNEVFFELIVKWKDVFRRIHEFPVELTGAIDASPNSPRKRRSKTGVLFLRMQDARPDDAKTADVSEH